MVSDSVWCGQICQRETQVFKTRVSPFYFFPSSSTHSSSSRAVCFSFFFFVLRRYSMFFDAADRLTQIVSLPLFFNAANQLAQIVLSSSELHIVHLQICWFFLCSSSYRSWFGLLQNRVLETQFCFLKLKSLRLEIYVAIPTQISK